MSHAKHSPGIWLYGDGSTVKRASILKVLSMSNGEPNGLSRKVYEIGVEGERFPPGIALVNVRDKYALGNARLIAASPRLVKAVRLFQRFFDEMPKGQFGNISCDIGLMNDAFLASRAATDQVEGRILG